MTSPLNMPSDAATARARTRRTLRGLLGAVAVLVAGGALAAADPGSGAAASGACGAATRGVLATVDAEIVTRIDANELAGTEVSADLRHVSTSRRLIGALARHDVAAARVAVAKLVYHHGWHIVRLRVLDRAGRLVADVGGPYVIAPVSGLLLSASGGLLGSFVLSVQDDVGVTKLESHFVGDPIGVYYHGALVAALGARLPAAPPSGPSLTLGGVGYATVWRSYYAFPHGTLRVLLLVPPPAAALTMQSCALVRVGEFGRVARRLTTLLGPIARHYYGYAYWVHIYTGAEVFVRDPGLQLASSNGSNPSSLPRSGRFSYEGRNWLVYSFEPSPPERVYLLVAAS
jgi:hypothetical protein